MAKESNPRFGNASNDKRADSYPKPGSSVSVPCEGKMDSRVDSSDVHKGKGRP